MDVRTVDLDREDLDGTIKVLSGAAQALQLSRFERLSYQALMASVDLASISLVLAFPIATMIPQQGRELKEGASWLELAFWVLIFLMVVALIIGVVAAALNIPLLHKASRERSRLRALGLSSLTKSLWKERRRTRWSRRARQALLIVAGTLGLFVAVHSSLTPAHPDEVAIFVVYAALLFSARYLRNQRERMDLTASAEELEKALQSLRHRAGKTGTVSVPSELLEQTAKIEQVQIAKQRQDAVLESTALRTSGYPIAFDRAAAAQRAALGVADRVELENLVAQLSTDDTQLKTGTAAASGADGAFRITTESKRVAIEYTVDHKARGIRIMRVFQTSLSGAGDA